MCEERKDTHRLQFLFLKKGVMYVFGGFDGEQRVNSFHAYNFAEKRWSPVRVRKL
jgi:hypothetical protein